MLFWNVKLEFELNLKLKYFLVNLPFKLVLRRRKRSDCGVSYETLGISPLIEIGLVLASLSKYIDVVLQENPGLPVIIRGDFNARISDKNVIYENTLH